MRVFLRTGWLNMFLAICILVLIVSLFVIRINDLNSISNENKKAFCQYMRDVADQPGTSDMTPGTRARADALSADAKQVMIQLGCSP